MKKKHMMMNHLLEENNVYKTQAPLPRRRCTRQYPIIFAVIYKYNQYK